MRRSLPASALSRMAISSSLRPPASTPRSSKLISAMRGSRSGKRKPGTTSSLRSRESTNASSSNPASECSSSRTPNGDCIRSGQPLRGSPKRFSGLQRSGLSMGRNSSPLCGSGLLGKPINHFSRNHDEVLLPMRKDDGGRTALLRHLRQNLRREALPALAREPTRGGGLLEGRQPGTLDAAAKGSDESSALGPPRPACLRALALLCLSESCHRPAPHTGGSATHGRLRNALGRPLVALVETARLVSRCYSFFLAEQEAER